MPGIQPIGSATGSSAGHGYGIKKLLEVLQSQEQHCSWLIGTEASFLTSGRPAHDVIGAAHCNMYCEGYGVSVKSFGDETGHKRNCHTCILSISSV